MGDQDALPPAQVHLEQKELGEWQVINAFLKFRLDRPVAQARPYAKLYIRPRT
jgi:hypothetical protein